MEIVRRRMIEAQRKEILCHQAGEHGSILFVNRNSLPTFYDKRRGLIVSHRELQRERYGGLWLTPVSFRPFLDTGVQEDTSSLSLTSYRPLKNGSDPLQLQSSQGRF